MNVHPPPAPPPPHLRILLQYLDDIATQVEAARQASTLVGLAGALRSVETTTQRALTRVYAMGSPDQATKENPR